ncbi:MAG TPA: hypothetical protein VF816_00960 [Rhodocyclaceae bacterium]
MRILLIAAALLAAGIARGQDIVAPPVDAPILSADEKRTLEDRAKSLHEKADKMRQDAEANFAAENNACWQKFLVSSCQKDAKKAKTARMMEASAVEREAREIDRSLRKSNFAEQQTKKAEEAPQRAADAAEQAEKNRKEREEAMARVEKKRQEAEQREKR